MRSPGEPGPQTAKTGPAIPYVDASRAPAELTGRAVLLGSVFGILFGASTVYLGLRAGLTVGASIPIAVLAISVLRRLGHPTILENNMVQTIGSAGESVAAGVVFTLPALLFLTPSGPDFFTYGRITLLTLAGGLLGVLMMVPLRRALIVREHETLPYPEGTACAEVLVAGEQGGALAGQVFRGLGVGAVAKALTWIFNLFRSEIGYSLPSTSQFPNATLTLDTSPEYLGVGYVIGPRIAGTMVAGGVLSWLVLLPLLSLLGQVMTVPLPPVHPSMSNNPATGLPYLLSEMSPGQIWSAYIRYIGAGAVLAAGILTLFRTLPTIIGSARSSLAAMGNAGGSTRLRTERDVPMLAVLAGSGLLALLLLLTPALPTYGNLVAAALVLAFGFFFSTVSARICGLIGSSSNPVSGMTIATLILTCVLFVALGWTGDAYAPIALSVGAIVCIAAANAGNTSQDLKTGFLLGATPLHQQIGLLVGVVVSAGATGWAMLYLHRVFGIGSADFAAPQATLMSTIITGLLNQDLPWGLVLVGIFLSVTLELCGVHSLSFAVGTYLPIATTAPIFVGGLVRAYVDRGGRTGEEVDGGTLFSSGLIAGGSVAGIAFAVLVGSGSIDALQQVGEFLPWFHGESATAHLATGAMFLIVAGLIARATKRAVQ